MQATDANEDDECYDFEQEQRVVRRVHLFYLDMELPAATGDTQASSCDVTLVSQLSIDRLQMLEMVARHWPGPMSIALYLSDTEVQRFVSFVFGSEVLSSRSNIAYHIVYRDGVSGSRMLHFTTSQWSLELV